MYLLIQEPEIIQMILQLRFHGLFAEPHAEEVRALVACLRSIGDGG
jgi:hypothetical protein